MDILKNNIVETAADDTVDGPNYQRQTSGKLCHRDNYRIGISMTRDSVMIPTSACCEKKYLRKAVLYATSEDDPETLEALKEWALDNGKVERTEKLNCYCPMIVACIEVKFTLISQFLNAINPYSSSSEVFQMHSNSVCHELQGPNP